MEPTNIAVIGLGGISQVNHLPILNKMSNVKVVALCDINKSRLLSVAHKFGVKHTFTDYKEMIKNTDIDALIIATPTSSHKEIAIDCIEAKKNLLIEKPIARTFKETEEIVNAAKKNKVQIMVGMNMRYRPDIMLLKSIINAGDLGTPFYVKLGWLRKQSSEGKWFTKKEDAGGGVILDLGIVLLDIALWLLNFPAIKTVSTHNYAINTKTVEDASISFMRCQPDSIISLETSWSLSSEKDSFYLNVHGSKGSASLNPLRIIRRNEDQQIDLTPFKSENPLALFKKSYTNELKHFIGAVRGLNPILSTGNEALSRMKIVENMYKSAKENSEILM
jgi:predicted dehydrogenase